MAILDRPLFKKRLSKDQLRQYGIPAFANGGFIEINPGLSQAMLGDATALSNLVRSPQQILEQDYGSVGQFIAGERGKEAAKKKSTEEILALENALKLEAERKKKLKADAEAMRMVREKNKEQEKKNEEDVPKPEGDLTDPDDAGDKERAKLQSLEELVKEKSAIYKNLIGDPKEMLRQQGFLQLAQFGLNLASAKGGNFAEKVANSAKDPLQTFAALGQQAMKDERAIDLLAIESAEADIARDKKFQQEQVLKNFDKDTIDKYAEIIKKANPDANEQEINQRTLNLLEGKSDKTDDEIKNDLFEELVSTSATLATLDPRTPEYLETYNSIRNIVFGEGPTDDTIAVGTIIQNDAGTKLRWDGKKFVPVEEEDKKD
jgi:hypothetical protein